MGKKWNKTIKVLAGILVAIASICLIDFLVRHLFIPYINKDFYDFECGLLEQPYYYGGILSGIFSGLAFIAVVGTLFMQKRQADIQEKTAGIQRFETTFFNMLDLHQELTNGLMYNYSPFPRNDAAGRNIQGEETARGRRIFEMLYDGGFNFTQLGLKNKIQNNGIGAFEEFKDAVLFDHYFRHLYHILKFIDSSEQIERSKDDYTERYKYASILRATLSLHELVWIFYNGLSSIGREKFKGLIEKYSFLKNLRRDLLCRSLDLENEGARFDQSATDYDFFSTDEKGCPRKYYLGAFYTGKELESKLAERRSASNE